MYLFEALKSLEHYVAKPNFVVRRIYLMKSTVNKLSNRTTNRTVIKIKLNKTMCVFYTIFFLYQYHGYITNKYPLFLIVFKNVGFFGLYSIFFLNLVI